MARTRKCYKLIRGLIFRTTDEGYFCIPLTIRCDIFYQKHLEATLFLLSISEIFKMAAKIMKIYTGVFNNAVWSNNLHQDQT